MGGTCCLNGTFTHFHFAGFPGTAMLSYCLRVTAAAARAARRPVSHKTARWMGYILLCACCVLAAQLLILLRSMSSDHRKDVTVDDVGKGLRDQPAVVKSDRSTGDRDGRNLVIPARVVSQGSPKKPPEGDSLIRVQVPPVAVPALKSVVHDPSVMKAQIFKGAEIPDDMLSMTRPQYLPNFKNPCWLEKSAAGDKGANTTLDGVQVMLRCLPYFHLIGVDKSGTTDLWSRLSQHPDVARPQAIAGKETHWWSWRRFGFDLWTRSQPKLHFDWYLQTFDLPAVKILNTMKSLNNTRYHHVITGEGSPTYFWDFSGWELIPQNTGVTAEAALVTPHCLRHITPDVKLLLMLRHPVERLYSEYLFLDRFKSVHNVSANLFHLEVQQSVAMLELCARSHSTYHCLLNRTLHMTIPIRLMASMYSVWLEQWLKVFPRHQMLIIRNEDYSKNIRHHLQTIMDFLGLAALPPSDLDKITAQERAFVRNNQDKAVGDMLPETRKLLTNFYSKYNEKLATMLSDQRFLWQEGGQ